jgi:D-2-hydroxyacid dehydrogenase (NADP+)
MAETPLEIVIVNEHADVLRQRIEAAFPGVIVHGGLSEAQVAGKTKSARVLMGLAQHISAGLVAATPKLEWIQALTTGVDPLLDLGLPERVTVTSARGIHGPQMSEMAFMMMLNLGRDFPRMLDNQRRNHWERWPQRLLQRKTAVIVGIGAISEELARRCQTFGMRTIGISSARANADGFDEIRTRDELIRSSAEADFLIALAAYTPQTHHLISATVLDALPAHGFFINLARGPVVDEAALIDRLRTRRFAGAGLDVFNVEPLPADSALWTLPNVILTPHLGGMSDIYADQVTPLVIDNIRAFVAGRRGHMRNIVLVSGARP